MINSKWTSLRCTFRRWIDTALQGNHHHYLCRLPEHLDYLSTAILRLFFSDITTEENQTSRLKMLHDEGIVVYATKYKRNFEYLFYNIRYRRMGLPYPEIGFDYRVLFLQPISTLLKILLANIDFFIFNLAFPSPYNSGYFQEELINGRVGFLSLIDKRSFYQRFVKAKTDPIQHLIDTQQKTDRPIFIVPQLLFYDRDPDRSSPNIFDILFGSKGNPGRIRRIATLIINPKNVFVETSEPLNLKQFLSLPENRDQRIETLSRVLRHKLIVRINRHRQSVTGPVLKSREELKESILTRDRLQKFFYRYSKSRNIPLQQVHKEADTCLEEIAANYSVGFVKIASFIVKKLIDLMFEGVFVNTDALNRVRQMSHGGPLILLPCHKSHMDYLILSYLLYSHNMPCPHIAAGKNLSFWPMGTLFRAGGAFFIRRSFRGAMLYARVFSEYIHKLLEEGFNIEFFLEGTRSRTGKLIMPKLGLLSILLNAFRNGACEDMIFVPIFIGYDQVLEEGAYLKEIEGGQKKPESLLQVIKARKFLKHRYGRIYIQFHDPISLKKLTSDQGLSIREMTTKEQNALCRNLAFRVLNAIDNVAVVTPHALFASAVLNCSKTRFSYDQLMFHWKTYLNYLSSNNAKLADTLTTDANPAVNHLLDTHVQQKLIEIISDKKDGYAIDTLFKINESRRPILEYYRNNCIAFFIPPAFTSLAILAINAFQFAVDDILPRYSLLQNFFKNEFAYNVDKPVTYFVQKNIAAFLDDGILLSHPTLPDTYNLTSTGLKKLKLYSSFLRPYFESYWIVLNYFMQYSQDSIDAKERLKKIQVIGNRMYKRHEIELKEALSKVNYDNAVGYFITHGVKGSENTEKIEFYADEIRKHLSSLSS